MSTNEYKIKSGKVNTLVPNLGNKKAKADMFFITIIFSCI